MLSIGTTRLVDKSGEEGVSAFVISGEPSPAKPQNTGFFPVTGDLGISHQPTRHHATACCRRLVPVQAKFSTWLEHAPVFDRIFRAAKFSTWLEHALGSINLRARSTNERREGGFIIGAEFHEFFGRGVPGSGAIIVEALLQILTFQ